MGIYRVEPEKDTTISEVGLTANTGLSPFLDVFSRINPDTRNKEYGRTLIKFPISSATAAINTGIFKDPNDDSTVTSWLKFFNCNHGEESSKSFTLNIFPLIQDWDEGSGITEQFITTGYANAVSANSSNSWTVSGGTYVIDSNSGSQAFDAGFEHLKVDVSAIVREWISGNTANHGFIVKMTESQESASGTLSGQNYNLKRFYSRETNTHKFPHLEFEWPNEIDDDREAGIEAGGTGALYFYNKVGNKFTDLSGTSCFPGTISISGYSPSGAPNGGGSSAIFTSLSAERRRVGVYRCVMDTFPLSAAPGDTSYTSYADVWVASGSLTGHSASSASGSFTVLKAFQGDSALEAMDVNKWKLAVRSFPREIEKDDVRLLRTNIRKATGMFDVLTGATTAATLSVVKDLRYQIREAVSDEVEVDWQPASRDPISNYVDLDTSYLSRGVEYKLLFKLTVEGEVEIIDRPDIYTFEVV